MNPSLFIENPRVNVAGYRTTGDVAWRRKGNRKLRARMMAQADAAAARRDENVAKNGEGKKKNAPQVVLPLTTA